MKIRKNMPIITTKRLDDVRDFYTKHFAFRVAFDCPGRYLGMQSSENPTLEIAFMEPSDCGAPYEGQGATFCFEVDDVDAEYTRLKADGLSIPNAPQDNPWGDRSFTTVDPVGISLYVYKAIEPTEEFKQYIKA